MTSGYQQTTLLLVVALAIASLWRGQHLQNLWSDVTNMTGNLPAMTPDLVPIGLDAIFVVVIVFIAGLSDTAGKLSIALVVGLWLLFLGVVPLPGETQKKAVK